MRLVDIGQCGLPQPFRTFDRRRLHDGRVNPYTFKQIGEAPVKPFQRSWAGVERNFPLVQLCDLAEIVDPVTMIGMVVSDDNPIDGGQPCCQHLLAKVRTAIHQKPVTTAFDCDRRASTPVARL